MKYKLFVGGKYGQSSIQHRGDPNNTISKILTEKGIQITTLMDEATHYLSIDTDRNELRKIEKNGIPTKSRFLVIHEPKVVLPANFSKKNLEKFGAVVRVGRPPKIGRDSLLWPQFWPKSEIDSRTDSRERSGAALIASNHLSFIDNELYSLRRSCAFLIPNLSVFGQGWNRDLKGKIKAIIISLQSLANYPSKVSRKSLTYWFSSLKKSVKSPIDKLVTLQDFKVNVVIENSAEFLTEKLFDAFFAKCIPVYVGPNVSDFLIPENLLVQCEPNIRSITEGIRTAEQMDYQSWRKELDSWLNAPETVDRWSHQTYILKLSKILEELIH
jgi:hypothetical protein